MNFIGIDPDTKNTGICFIGGDGKILRCECARGVNFRGLARAIRMVLDQRVWERGACVRGPFIVAIEDQEIAYSSRQGVNPRSMIPLAQAAGMAFALSCACLDLAEIVLVKPQAWKGSVDKVTHQGRVFDRLRLSYVAKKDYCIPAVPVPGADFPPSMWKHVADAVGLALWAYDQWVFANKIEKYRNK